MRATVFVLLIVLGTVLRAGAVPEGCKGCQLSEKAFKSVEGRWLSKNGDPELGDVLEFKGRREVRIDGKLWIPCEDGDRIYLCGRGEEEGQSKSFKAIKKGRELLLLFANGTQRAYVWPLGCPKVLQKQKADSLADSALVKLKDFRSSRSGQGSSTWYSDTYYHFLANGEVEMEESSAGSLADAEVEMNLKDRGTFVLLGQTVIICLERGGVRELEFDGQCVGEYCAGAK